MKMDKKKVLNAVLILIIAGAAVFGIGRAIYQDTERSYSMEKQSYAVSEVTQIQINTDSPSVVVRPVSSDQISLTWQEDKYVEFDAELTDGKLSVTYRVSANWLENLLLMPLAKNDYVLEVELPDDYQGGLAIQTASGAITVDTAAALSECGLKSASGGIDAVNIDCGGITVISNTSGHISVTSAHAADDILMQTVSGSVEFLQSAALGDISVKTTSGRISLSQVECDGSVTLESISGSLKPSGVACASLTAKTTSGSISFEDVTTNAIDMKSTSGSINGTVGGKREEYDISVHTVSGSKNLENAGADTGKTLKFNTVSGSVKIQFSGE